MRKLVSYYVGIYIKVIIGGGVETRGRGKQKDGEDVEKTSKRERKWRKKLFKGKGRQQGKKRRDIWEKEDDR